MKTPLRLSLAAFGALAVAGCGGGKGAAENNADQLDKAANQSTPAAATVLNQAASEIRERNIADPNAAQSAMQAAGNAQANAGPQKAPPQMGAKPHRPGDPVPPPKLQRGQGMTGNAGSNNPAVGTGNH